MAHYPPLTEASLTPFRAIEVQLGQDPGFLDRDDCPYQPMVKAMLRRLIGGEKVDTGTTDLLVDESDGALDREIAAIYQTVKTDMRDYSGTDMKDKMSFLKTGNDLLTKLVDLQSKRYNIRNMARMQRAVIESMEVYLTPAQRTEMINKLEGYIDV